MNYNYFLKRKTFEASYYSHFHVSKVIRNTVCLQDNFNSISRKPDILTLSPPLNQAKIGGFGGLQFSEKGDEGIAASPRINHFVQNFTENTMVKSAIF